ncbi:death-associated protein 1-like [Dromiciops gliroides]|uniref:death-associated protein 1-like n=1 Tax=Dromiciops gliroides TaxID=33562 RepID=UPI001CC5501D|nr:death-associated protein 1-like [Dromiciops gliroides]
MAKSLREKNCFIYIFVSQAGDVESVSTTSSPTEEKVETRAGHPPVIKAGGMRIVQKHPLSGDAKEERDKDDQEWESTSPPKPTVYISGVIARGDKDFPPAAAQVAHQKPHHPSMEKHPSHKPTQHIQQPCK